MKTSFPSGTLENEFFALLGKDRNAAITARYLGLDGLGGASLQKVGDEAGITRERVRQITARVLAVRLDRDAKTPIFDRVISFIEEDLPSLASDIASELQFRGLTANYFELDGLFEGARLLGRRLPFTIADRGRKILIRDKECGIVQRVITQARANVCHWGMSSVSNIARQMVRGRLSNRYSERSIRRIVEWQQKLQWLDECAEWFWLPDVPSNRVVHSVRKILAVAGTLPLELLVKAIRRNPRMRGFDPPRAVFLEFCGQMPDIFVEGDRLYSDGSLDPETMLSPVERLMVGTLTMRGGALNRAEIILLCKKQGINPLTSGHYLGYSPIITYDSRAGSYSPIGAMKGIFSAPILPKPGPDS